MISKSKIINFGSVNTPLVRLNTASDGCIKLERNNLF